MWVDGARERYGTKEPIALHGFCLNEYKEKSGKKYVSQITYNMNYIRKSFINNTNIITICQLQRGCILNNQSLHLPMFTKLIA